MKNIELSDTCQTGIREACQSVRNACEPDLLLEKITQRAQEYESEFGRMIYTISILLMFSFVIILLMVRSIKRTNSTVEMDALLDAMRFREELDIQDRQRRRLMKAKTKVTAWLNRGQQSNRKESDWSTSYGNAPKPRNHFSISTGSDIPEIVVSQEDSANQMFPRPHTPAISLIYNFAVSNEEEDRRKSSLASSIGIPTSSSSSSLASSIENRSVKKNNKRTFSLESSSSARIRRTDLDDKTLSLDN